ncbi:hypothetical protein A1O1_05293 [Capronia coronata CBS 617.96]|uniref:Uncharacterized protein n=1 Tax=Capronia coronata CBS 617.96 TaxID=1182541 RepID=W9Y785_9EURO|nr:uncharacterized protein A1O1_05293 [Capronia coronata CBS 617.96]EXJ88363.1 hypothetical protein A1O1_05293 [Capronia coronata CBS 617.96]
MSVPVGLEAQRLKNLQQKQRLLEELNLNLNLHSEPTRSRSRSRSTRIDEPEIPQRGKRRRLNPSTSTSTSTSLPSRTSARIAASGTRVSYTEERHETAPEPALKANRIPQTSKRKHTISSRLQQQPSPPPPPYAESDLSTLLDRYNNWTPTAPEPTLFPDGTYQFPSHPTFKPNKSPLSILLEGAFGGHYFSPWHSRTLGLTLQGDHQKTLPAAWLAQLQPVTKYLTSPIYDASLNRYGVVCGQTLTQWEDAGWINFTHDPRGWFEWYIRFWLGRRCEDGEDERQVGRWVRCVGPRGRWKRLLLKKYVELGVRSIFDDDFDGDGDGSKNVSPVMHQTCHHWAYQVTQEDLDDAWRERRGT